MIRKPLMLPLVWIGCSFIAASVVAEDVVAIKLIPLAELPIYVSASPGVMTAWRNHAADLENRTRRAGRVGHVMLTDEGYQSMSEYRVISDWIASHNDHAAPDYLDLVAVIENRGTVPVGPIDVELYRDRKVGETAEAACNAPLAVPHPRTQATWEGLVMLDSNAIDILEAKTVLGLKLGSFAIHEDLLDDLRTMGMWPWDVKYEVRLRCTVCSRDTVSVSIPMGQVC